MSSAVIYMYMYIYIGGHVGIRYMRAFPHVSGEFRISYGRRRRRRPDYHRIDRDCTSHMEYTMALLPVAVIMDLDITQFRIYQDSDCNARDNYILCLRK